MAIHSKLAVVTLDTSAGTPTDISTYCNSLELPREMEEIDVTTFGATFKDFIPGFAEGTVTMGGPWTRALDNHMSPIFTAFQNETITGVTLVYGPEGSTSGDVKYTAELRMLNYSGPKADIGSALEWDAEFRVTGAGVTVSTY